MTTLTQMIADLRNHLGDTLAAPQQSWPDAQLQLWIQKAIADYSVYFPRRMDETLEAIEDQFEFELADNFHAIISLEYQPGGVSTDPPTYYKRANYTDPSFWSTEGVYDVKEIDDSTSGSAYKPSVLIIHPPAASAADTYLSEYLGDHYIPTSGAGTITVPDRHIPILYQYVRWQAIGELSTGVKRITVLSGGGGTIQNPYSEIDLFRAYQNYQKMILTAKKADSESVVVHWEMDKWGRVG
jgi:hypothetical protein